MKLLITMALFFGTVEVASAMTGRMIKLQGFLVKNGGSQAVIKDDKGTMIVPSESVDTEHVKIGQWITVSVDFVELYRMNPSKFKTAPSNH